MQTKKVLVSNRGEGLDEILNMVDETAQVEHLSNRNKLHLRLLTEEMISMIKVIAGEFDALFWIEGDAGDYRLCLTARTDVDAAKKRDLLAVSSTGENVAARGIMGKIREIIENGILSYDEIERMNMENSMDYLSYGFMGMGAADAASQSLFVWSLSRYRDNLENVKNEDSEKWDELEKSIVANIADEVKVGIRKDKVEMTIYKRFRD